MVSLFRMTSTKMKYILIVNMCDRSRLMAYMYIWRITQTVYCTNDKDLWSSNVSIIIAWTCGAYR